jgi:hypothetical protein
MNRTLQITFCILAFFVFQEISGQSSFLKNNISVGIINSTSSIEYQGLGYYKLEPYNSLHLIYSRRISKNIFLSASTYKIADVDSRRYTLGSKVNALVSYRIQPGVVMDYAFPTTFFAGEFQLGSSLDLHVGNYFVIGTTLRFGTEESLLYGFNGTVKF